MARSQDSASSFKKRGFVTFVTSHSPMGEKTLKNRYKKYVKACQSVSKYVNRYSSQQIINCCEYEFLAQKQRMKQKCVNGLKILLSFCSPPTTDTRHGLPDSIWTIVRGSGRQAGSSVSSHSASLSHLVGTRKNMATRFNVPT